jgi:hypothetical protein
MIQFVGSDKAIGALHVQLPVVTCSTTKRLPVDDTNNVNLTHIECSTLYVFNGENSTQALSKLTCLTLIRITI